MLECGAHIGGLVTGQAAFTLTGRFPARVGGEGHGMFAGEVTIEAMGRLTGTTSPEADVYLTRDGVVVSAALPKDLVGALVDLGPGDQRTFPARGTTRGCPATELVAGHYEIYAVMSVIDGRGTPTIAVGGPWPVEVT